MTVSEENNAFGLRGHGELALHATSFLAWTTFVAVMTYLICKHMFPSKASASEDYFSGGRQLTWVVIAGSLMLTNLSTEQLVGLNGAIYKDGCLAGTGWETFAAVAMCATAGIFVPRYVTLGLSTTSGFLGERFDLLVRTIVSSVFLLFYALVLCPCVLYTGSLGLRNIFDAKNVPLWVVCLIIAVIGACYALFGGLKAVAVSDCLNGVGLIIVGLWVPFAALSKIGGLSALFEKPEYLKPLVGTGNIMHDGIRTPGEVSLPWHTYITGLSLINVYYWATNQLIVQRVLGAKSMAHAQKGVLFAAIMKVVGFTFLCLPGIIAMIFIEKEVAIDGTPFSINKPDEVYPEIVKSVMPTWSLGFFAAVLLGSVLSTFNSALNSASTLFGLELYKIYTFQRRDRLIETPSDEEIVKVSGIFGASLTVASIWIAPQLESVESIFDLIQKLKTLASLPIITIFLIGIMFKLPDSFAAKAALLAGTIIFAIWYFVVKEPHFLHQYFGSFVLASGVMFAATYLQPLRRCCGQEDRPVPYKENRGLNKVNTVQWHMLMPMIAMITALVFLLTVALQLGSMTLFIIFVIAWCIGLLVLIFSPVRDEEDESEEEDDEGEEY